MGWVRLDDQRALNRKLRAAGFEARGLDEAAICQIAADMTDGFIAAETVEMLAIAHRCKHWRKVVSVLVKVGRWEIADGGWIVHDYLEFNPSKAEWLATKGKKRDAGRLGGMAKAMARAKASAVANDVAPATADAVANGVANDLADPTRPEPDPIEPLPPPPTATPAREPDLLWDALIEACGVNAGELTKPARGAINAARKALADVGATPAEVRVRADRYRRTWPTVTLTAPALVKHWPSLSRDPAPVVARRDNLAGIREALELP